MKRLASPNGEIKWGKIKRGKIEFGGNKRAASRRHVAVKEDDVVAVESHDLILI
jgi:hypothetical protein